MTCDKVPMMVRYIELASSSSHHRRCIAEILPIHDLERTLSALVHNAAQYYVPGH